MGCLLIVPIMPSYGPAGILLVVAALYLLTSLLFRSTSAFSRTVVAAAALILILYPALRDDYISIRGHSPKRGMLEAEERGLIEYTRWDPVSKIDIVNAWNPNPNSKHIAYDGGNQSSFFFEFDGDLQALRARIPDGAAEVEFWGRKVLVSHYLKRDTGSEVLVIGSAGGQEIKAALTYGAARVDGVELVGTVVKLGKEDYSEYIGGVMNHPNVDVVHDEGRSFLRSTDRLYDIIQIFSNHTSSSIAEG